MACNENIIKNMANEVTRNCQAFNVNVEPEFVVYLIELLLLNPKYGKLFTKTLNRNSLAHFVNECVAMINRGGIPLNTLKMQFIVRSNYSKPATMISKHQDHVDSCLKPLTSEILEADCGPDDDGETRKLYRKIAIYIILASGLGNPAVIMNLKEGMAALESVFSMEELGDMLQMTRSERGERLSELLQLTSGVRLFNMDSKKGGDTIQDLPFDLVDAGNACLSTLSNTLLTVMQRVNSVTTAVEDQLGIHEETGNVTVAVRPDCGLTEDDYRNMFELLIFYRQYEIYIRRLLTDVEGMVATANNLRDRCKIVLEELHTAVKYKSAVPVDTVFPLFKKLWDIWRSMQNSMFFLSTVSRLMAILNNIQEHNRIPSAILDNMLNGRKVITDEQRVAQSGSSMSLDDRIAVSATLTQHSGGLLLTPASVASTSSYSISFLGFCTMCLTVGALVPSNLRIGHVKHRGARFAFANVKMATRFTKDPDRYVNEVLDYARNHPQLINLLNMEEIVYSVKDIDVLVTKFVPKKKVSDQEIQTALHPVEEYKEHNYNWDLWEWKRRACQWATIVNCQTHSTQTNYSHLRSEIHCQTYEPRDKCLQTKKTTGVNTNTCNYYLWGLRGQLGDGQHSMDLEPKHAPEKPKGWFHRQEFDVPKVIVSVTENLKSRHIISSTWATELFARFHRNGRFPRDETKLDRFSAPENPHIPNFIEIVRAFSEIAEINK